MSSSDEPTGTARVGSADPATTIKAVPVRHPWRWVAVAVITVLTAMLVHSMVDSTVDTRGTPHQPRWEWSVIGHWMFASPILHGVVRTILLTVVCMAIGIVLGTFLAVMRLSPNPVVSGSSWFYIWFFRGTPVLVQLIFWYYLAYLYPVVSLGVPFGPSWIHIHTTTALSKFLAAMIGLGLNEAAYMAEIVRAGIISVDAGQTEAASALGMSRLLVMRRIVLPQAMRVIVPPTGNETISMLKSTSLASVIAYAELTYAAQLIYSVNYKTVPLLIVISIWYLAITSVFYVGQYYIERYYGRGTVFGQPAESLPRKLWRLVWAPRAQRAASTAALLSDGEEHR